MLPPPGPLALLALATVCAASPTLVPQTGLHREGIVDAYRPTYPVAFSPDAKTLTTVDKGGMIFLRDATTGR